MHDQRKVKAEVDEKTRERTEMLIQTFRRVTDDIFSHKKSGDESPAMLAKIDALLELNPEQYSVFNYRRNILQAKWRSTEGTGDALEPVPEDLAAEVKLNTKILMADYKVYSAWLHRRWLYTAMTRDQRGAFLEKERAQCEALLKLDERNFHAWGYRRWVALEQRRLAASKDVTHTQQTAELAFTKTKIERSISNYSAWHNRALVFGELLTSAGVAPAAVAGPAVARGASEPADTAEQAAALEGLKSLLALEVQLVIKAFYVDPDDQSTWFYAESLLSVLAAAGDALKEVLQRAAEDIATCCVELREDALGASTAPAPATKGLQWPTWMLLALHRHGTVPIAPEQQRRLWQDLVTVDTQRAGYYREQCAAVSS